MKKITWKTITNKLQPASVPVPKSNKKSGLVARKFRNSRYVIALDDISETDLFDTYQVLKKAGRAVKCHSKHGRFVMEVKDHDKTAWRLTKSTM